MHALSRLSIITQNHLGNVDCAVTRETVVNTGNCSSSKHRAVFLRESVFPVVLGSLSWS